MRCTKPSTLLSLCVIVQCFLSVLGRRAANPCTSHISRYRQCRRETENAEIRRVHHDEIAKIENNFESRKTKKMGLVNAGHALQDQFASDRRVYLEKDVVALQRRKIARRRLRIERNKKRMLFSKLRQQHHQNMRRHHHIAQATSEECEEDYLRGSNPGLGTSMKNGKAAENIQDRHATDLQDRKAGGGMQNRLALDNSQSAKTILSQIPAGGGDPKQSNAKNAGKQSTGKPFGRQTSPEKLPAGNMSDISSLSDDIAAEAEADAEGGEAAGGAESDSKTGLKAGAKTGGKGSNPEGEIATAAGDKIPAVGSSNPAARNPPSSGNGTGRNENNNEGGLQLGNNVPRGLLQSFVGPSPNMNGAANLGFHGNAGPNGNGFPNGNAGVGFNGNNGPAGSNGNGPSRGSSGNSVPLGPRGPSGGKGGPKGGRQSTNANSAGKGGGLFGAKGGLFGGNNGPFRLGFGMFG